MIGSGAQGAGVSSLSYAVRRLLVGVPVLLGIVLLLMAALRLQDPVRSHLGPFAPEGDVRFERERLGLDRPFAAQYAAFVGRLVRLDFDEASWEQPDRSVGEMLSRSIVPSLSITLPALLLGTLISLGLGLWAAARRGRGVDRAILLGCALAMSLSSLVVVAVGQMLGTATLNDALGAVLGRPVSVFAIEGYEPGVDGWLRTCLLPVILCAFVGIGPDTRFHRAALVEELGRESVLAARARGVGPRRLLWVHVLRNALLPILTRFMTTLPYVVVGSILVETFFNVPGMGRRLIEALATRDFPVIQAFTAVYAMVFVAAQVLTDLLYAWADPRVRWR